MVLGVFPCRMPAQATLMVLVLTILPVPVPPQVLSKWIPDSSALLMVFLVMVLLLLQASIASKIWVAFTLLEVMTVPSAVPKLGSLTAAIPNWVLNTVLFVTDTPLDA